RMINAVDYLAPACSASEPQDSYLLSNVDENGDITELHNGFVTEKKLSIEDVQNFYHISNIGYQRNLEGHIFQISSSDVTGTVEWVAINDNALSVFVPYYSMLTTDVYDALKLSTAEAEFVTEAPESGVYYPTTVNMRIDGERVAVEGYMVLPENWAESVYWTNDALSNTVLYNGLDEETVASVYSSVYDLQAKVNADFAAIDPATLNSETATAWSMAQSAAVHAATLELFNSIAE
ncbi:MAG: C69 family dipeptidase, partial [Clostridia bacterium]|nr:C69 family dipeptidase [Clostridia bacterium]